MIFSIHGSGSRSSLPFSKRRKLCGSSRRMGKDKVSWERSGVNESGGRVGRAADHDNQVSRTGMLARKGLRRSYGRHLQALQLYGDFCEAATG